MDSCSFEKVNKLVINAVVDPAFRDKPADAVAKLELVPLTAEERELLDSLQPDIARFSACSPKAADAAFWSTGLLVSSCAAKPISDEDEWTVGFLSIPMIRHRTDTDGQEWTLRFASIPMIRHPAGGAK